MKNNTNKTQFLKYIFYLLLIIPFFNISYLSSHYSKISEIYDISIILSSLIILILNFLKPKKNTILSFAILYSVVLVLSSLVNNVFSFSTIGLIIKSIGLSLLVNYGITNDRKIFLKSLSLFLWIIITINFFTILLYPKGMYISNTGFSENWFLGYKNTHILYYLPYLLISFTNDYLDKNKVSLFHMIMSICIFVFSILVNNSTAIVGLTLLFLCLIFSKKKINTKIFNPKLYYIIFILLFILIVVLRVQNIFSFLIEEVLNKDLTFTGRVYVWDKAIKYIIKKPIIGYGNISFSYNEFIYSTHNMILGILHKTGIIGTSIFMTMIYKLCKIVNSSKNKVNTFLGIILLVYFVMMTMEYYNLEFIIYIFIIISNISLIYTKGGKNNEKSITSQ